jgi:DNA-directed RNA polymerase I subunit RPA49
MHHCKDFPHGTDLRRYMVGVFDRSANELTLRHAPLYVVRHQIKALKSLEKMMDPKHDYQHDYQHARSALGEAFGTKKAKVAIRAAEKNKVDVAAMKDVCTSGNSLPFSHTNHPQVADTLQSIIRSKTAALPKAEEAKAEANSNRPIPPFNANATRPSEVGSNFIRHVRY